MDRTHRRQHTMSTKFMHTSSSREVRMMIPTTPSTVRSFRKDQRQQQWIQLIIIQCLVLSSATTTMAWNSNNNCRKMSLFVPPTYFLCHWKQRNIISIPTKVKLSRGWIPTSSSVKLYSSASSMSTEVVGAVDDKESDDSILSGMTSNTDDDFTPNNESSSSNSIPLIQLAIAGGITTFVADICMHPMDTVKTVLQSDVGIGWTMMQAATYLVDNGGITAFYSGFLTYACTDAVGGAFKFTVWELWKQQFMTKILNHLMIFRKDDDDDSTISNVNSDDDKILLQRKILTTLLLWVGAALAFIASSIVIVPGELLKQQLQMSHYNTLLEAVAVTYEQSGLQGFFTGYEGVLYRDVPYTMIELGLYEVLKGTIDDYKKQQQPMPVITGEGIDAAADDKVMSSSSSTSWYEEIGAAAITGAIASFCTTPLDAIKTKLMLDQELYPDFTFMDCMIDTVHQHGYSALFAGVTARMAWIVPFTIFYLPTYDFLKRLLQKYRDDQQANIEEKQRVDEQETLSKQETIRASMDDPDFDALAATTALISPFVASTLNSTTTTPFY